MKVVPHFLKSRKQIHAFLVNDQGEVVATLKRPVDSLEQAYALAEEYEGKAIEPRRRWPVRWIVASIAGVLVAAALLIFAG